MNKNLEKFENNNQQLDEIIIKYKIFHPNVDKIKIFDSSFISMNKENCHIIYNGEKYELTEYFKIRDNPNKNNKLLDVLEIKLLVYQRLPL